jgi:hypothetical protein
LPTPVQLQGGFLADALHHAQRVVRTALDIHVDRLMGSSMARHADSPVFLDQFE